MSALVIYRDVYNIIPWRHQVNANLLVDLQAVMYLDPHTEHHVMENLSV